MNEVALLILFNHNYEKNIEKLEALYKDRFSNIYFIMPFYEGSKKNVITVYGNSYFFQGYIAHALKQIRDQEYGHYMVIGDDLILNPHINELNFKEYFKVDQDTGFIPHPFLLNDIAEKSPNRRDAPFWEHVVSALKFKVKQKGIQVAEYLPSYEDALKSMSAQGMDFTPEMPTKYFVPKPLFKRRITFIANLKRLKVFLYNLKYIILPTKIPYPMVGSYSDIVIVPHAHKEKFSLYAGVLASLNLFVEIALPSALIYAVPKVVTEKQLASKGLTYWTIADFKMLEIKYDRSLANLFANFPADCLYIHPIKLSRYELD